MRVVIQSTQTSEFLKPDKTWAPSASEAIYFPTSMRALDFCIRHKLKDIQLVLRFDDGTPDAILPVEEHWSRLGSFDGE
jgi:hypothetical protein